MNQPSKTAIVGGLLTLLCLAQGRGIAAPEPRIFPPPEGRWWEPLLAAPQSGVELLFAPVEAGVNWAERTNLPERVQDALYFNEERTFGWLPKISVGGDIESGVGASIFHRSLYGGGEEVSASVLRSLSSPVEEGDASLEGFFPSALGSQIGVRAALEVRSLEDGEFFLRLGPAGGLRPGRETDEGDERSAEVDVFRGRIEGRRFTGGEWSHGLVFAPIFGEVGPGEGPRPPIASTLDGVGRSVLLLGGGPFLEWEGRDVPGRPRRGWFGRADGGFWGSVKGESRQGEPFRFVRYSLDLRRYQPTFFHDRVVVVRTRVERVERADGAVPFWDRPILDKDAGLRGFDRNRFQDEGALLVNAEYRYPVWDAWDAFLFFDEGQVFRNWSDIDASGFRWAGGAGIRIYSAGSFLFQIHAAFSEEEEIVQIGLGEEF